MKHALTLLLLMLATLALSAQQSPAQRVDNGHDSLEISLLTCTPGTEVYELYGHTAIRVKDFKRQQDWVFNYGVFDFNTPHFAWRFMLGQTDYILNAVPYEHFVTAYAHNGRWVDEQIINLTPDEAGAIFAELDSIISIPGWSYRYNFLYDNCTTRAVATITNHIKGRIVWPVADGHKSFRDIIHQYAESASPWNCFGQDLILGVEVDQPIGRAQQMFAPLYAERFFAQAYINGNDGSRRPLVKATTKTAPTTKLTATTVPQNSHFPLSPTTSAILLLVAVTLFSLWAQKQKRTLCWLDDVLLLLQGTAGCIVGILFFFSEHPAVGSNWLIFFLNPLPLIYLPYKVWRNRHGLNDYYRPLLAVELIVLAGVFAISQQHFPVEVYILALVLLIRCILVVPLAGNHRQPNILNSQDDKI